ncbi:MAG: Ig-like domain-containing protein [Pseudonocardiaceae bacterium]
MPVTTGTATIRPILPVGTHSLTAVFTPDPNSVAFFTGSTSATVPYTVYATATATTTLTAAPNPALEGVAVVLIAHVTPFTAAGTIQFADGTTTLGAPVPVAAGFAFLTTSAPARGPHTLTAVFTPTDPVAFGPSTSPSRPLTVRPLFYNHHHPSRTTDNASDHLPEVAAIPDCHDHRGAALSSPHRAGACSDLLGTSQTATMPATGTVDFIAGATDTFDGTQRRSSADSVARTAAGIVRLCPASL